MAALDAFLFGYRAVTPDEGCEAGVINALLQLGICTSWRADGSFLVREADFPRFRAYAGGRVRYTATGPRGLPARIRSVRRHLPVLLSSLLSVALFFFLSHLVWDVRVEGAEGVAPEEIRSSLAEAGLRVGAIWDGIDPEAVEIELLSGDPRIAWVQINRKGTVAYVLVREKARVPNTEVPEPLCSNIVADFDGVVEEITVKSGEAAVKAGDVVKRGDILISGVVETEAGSYFTGAEGSVRASVVGKLEVGVDREEQSEVMSRERMASLSLRIFGIKINIFKNYGNTDSDCAIIEDNEEYLSLFGKRLPLSVLRAYRYVRESDVRVHSDSELPLIAEARMSEAMRSALDGADLIKLKTSGGYTDTGYAVCAEYVASREIGRVSEVILGGRGS